MAALHSLIAHSGAQQGVYVGDSLKLSLAFNNVSAKNEWL